MQFPTHYPVACHTKNVGKGSTFVAIPGFKQNGIAYIPQALDQGASTIVVAQHEQLSPDVIALIHQHKARLMLVQDTRLALAQLSAQAAGHPAQKLRIIGITGTKGKTTTAFMIEHVLRTAGYRTALLGTVKNSIMDHNLGVELTTQQPDYLHQFFNVCVDENIDYVVMEVAAQGLSMHRVHGIEFDGIIFTNFSQEHAEFYQSQDDYLAAKLQIFKSRKGQAPVVINTDDKQGEIITNQHPDFISYGMRAQGVRIGVDEKDGQEGLNFHITWKQHRSVHFASSAFIGLYNVYNMAAALILAQALGIKEDVLVYASASCGKVPGRMDRYVLRNGAQCIIDHAHTPSSFESVLSTLRSLTQQLIVVFGCGGERDAIKRPLMGSRAVAHADVVVLTTDNPRSEKPEAIIADIMQGIGDGDQRKVIVIHDRKEAIEYAYNRSRMGSIIALLGKGSDEYQHVGTVKTPFSEAAIIKSL